jgi:excisionase family DNA binding protein
VNTAPDRVPIYRVSVHAGYGEERTPRALKPMEVAAILGVGRSRIYQLLQSRELASIRVGVGIRVPLAWVEEYIERQRE